MNAKSSILCKIGFFWGPNGYPVLGLGLGWVIEVGPKTHMGWVLGPKLGPKLGFGEAYFWIHTLPIRILVMSLLVAGIGSWGHEMLSRWGCGLIAPLSIMQSAIKSEIAAFEGGPVFPVIN